MIYTYGTYSAVDSRVHQEKGNFIPPKKLTDAFVFNVKQKSGDEYPSRAY